MTMKTRIQTIYIKDNHQQYGPYKPTQHAMNSNLYKKETKNYGRYATSTR